jgi:hypothetical protein
MTILQTALILYLFHKALDRAQLNQTSFRHPEAPIPSTVH